MSECANKQDYIVLPSEGGGVPGPPGPPGPQGPPGIGELPVPAEDVSVTNPGFANAQEIFNFLLYTPIAINSFNATRSVFELGESIPTVGVNWSLNKTDIISQNITGLNDPVNLTIADRSATLNFSPALTATATVTLVVDDGVQVANRNRALNFYNGVYFGDAPIPIVLDSNFILSLSKTLQGGRGKTFTSNAGAGVYAWYANRVALGIANFKVGGFDGGFEPPVTVSFTNASGFTEDYYVYRSTNPQIGPATIQVS